MVVFEKYFNFLYVSMKAVGIPLCHPYQFGYSYFLLINMVGMFSIMLFCCCHWLNTNLNSARNVNSVQLCGLFSSISVVCLPLVMSA